MDYPISILTCDLETTYGKYLKRVGSPFSPDFTVCCSGWKADTNPVETEYYVRESDTGERTGGHGSHTGVFSSRLRDTQWLVGANIKFDNLWYWLQIREELKRGLKVWDVLYAHYLLTGQLHNLARPEAFRPSLNAVARYYGLPTKLDKVKALWDAGVRTEDIDEDILLEYQAYDVELTEKVFRLQLDEVKAQGRFNQIFQRMEGLLATTEMEFNGLYINEPHARALQRALEEKYAQLGEELNACLPDMPPEHTFNWGSSSQKAALIFGGSIKYEKWVQHTDEQGNPLYCQTVRKEPCTGDDGEYILFKSGKRVGEIKTKNVTSPDITRPKGAKQDFWFTLPGHVKPQEKWQTDSSKEARKADPLAPMKCGTGSEVLEELASSGIPFLAILGEWAKANKDLGTYYERDGKGMLTLINPADGCIHHELNHTQTVTSRLSSSKPNLQNLPSGRKSEVKSVFISRFPLGVITEIDYSQLEVVTKAVLSGDANLRRDLLNGVDFHCMNLALAKGEDYQYVWNKCHVEEDQQYCNDRQDIKAFTFQEKYGAGVKKMAESTGMTEEVIERLLAAKAKQYPDEAKFDEEVAEAVNSAKYPTGMRSPSGYPLMAGYWECPTGTLYSFLEQEAPEWKQKQGIFTDIKSTVLKNYPSQGAGGEIMQIQLGRMFRWLINSEFDKDCKLINTVHDSVYLDIRSIDTALEAVPTMVDILEDVSPYWKEKFGVDWKGMPFPVEAEIGYNMLDTKKIDHYKGD